MLTAGTSCGTVSGRGTGCPVAARFAKASMIGAKSVPALAKKYSTPRATSSSRYASAVLSTVARLVISLSPPRRGDDSRTRSRLTRFGTRPENAATRTLTFPGGLRAHTEHRRTRLAAVDVALWHLRAGAGRRQGHAGHR